MNQIKQLMINQRLHCYKYSQFCCCYLLVDLCGHLCVLCDVQSFCDGFGLGTNWSPSVYDEQSVFSISLLWVSGMVMSSAYLLFPVELFSVSVTLIFFISFDSLTVLGSWMTCHMSIVIHLMLCQHVRLFIICSHLVSVHEFCVLNWITLNALSVHEVFYNFNAFQAYFRFIGMKSVRYHIFVLLNFTESCFTATRYCVMLCYTLLVLSAFMKKIL